MKKPVKTKVSARVRTLASPSLVLAMMSIRKVLIAVGTLWMLLIIFCTISSANLMVI